MTSWRPFWIICIFWQILKVSRLGPGGFGISTSILTKSHQINLFMSKNKGDVFVYDVMAAILNNLHIVKKCSRSHVLAPSGFEISTFILTRNHQNMLYMSKNKVGRLLSWTMQRAESIQLHGESITAVLHVQGLRLSQWCERIPVGVVSLGMPSRDVYATRINGSWWKLPLE